MSIFRPVNRARKMSVTLLLCAWAVLTVGAFWQWVGRYMRPVPRPAGAAVLKPEQRPAPPLQRLETDAGSMSLEGHPPVTVINFWSPTCSCSQYMENHVHQLIRDYSPRGVRFVTVVEGAGMEESKQALLAAWRERRIDTPAAADGTGKVARAFGVWAAPAAVILDSQGRVVYVGAYNIARFCDNARTAYAQRALEAVLKQQTPPRADTPFYGCQVVPSS